LLQAAGLQVVGVEIPLDGVALRDQFMQTGADPTDLKAWDAFQQQHLSAFAQYDVCNVWCRKE
jgi:hypothetical protein